MSLETDRRASTVPAAPRDDGPRWAQPHDGITTDAGPLTDALTIERSGADEFWGWCGAGVRARAFGGQIAAQALLAAARTAPADRAVHSLHTMFVAPADPFVPVRYSVRRVRDGRSISSRVVTAAQGTTVVLHATCSLQRPETGLVHRPEAPRVPRPSKVPAVCRRPIELRPVAWAPTGTEPTAAHEQLLWFRAPDPLPREAGLHAAAVTFATDVTLGWTGWKAHGIHAVTADMFATSLDHTLWFHEVPRADEWLLLSQKCSATAGARSLASGQVFTAGGVLVASVVQEGLMRLAPERHA